MRRPPLAAAEGIYRSLPGAGFIDVNPAMARIFGYESPEQMLRELGRSSGHLIMDETHRHSIHERLMNGERIKAERGRAMRVIGTGGLAPLFATGEALFDEIRDDLTMHGLRVINDYNGNG